MTGGSCAPTVLLCVRRQQEVEEEEVEEVFMKKKYSTKKQTHALWDFLSLQYRGLSKIKAFYQASQFSIYKDSLFYNSGQAHPLPLLHDA